MNTVTRRKLHPITFDRIDPDAAKVVRRLAKFGYQAFLVGGCVRDLLLDRTPKDFDVSTNATPLEIKKLFRNCRIIGRRFRLAHIFFNTKIIETSTFRAPPPTDPAANGSDLLIWRDNLFGTDEEDARRRDFTINGLFYDLVQGRLIDYVGGCADLEAETIRTIGDPRIRFQEDPARILRAIKFAARLGFRIDPATEEAIVEFRGLISLCSSARVLEEIYRLLGCGAVSTAFHIMHRTGVLAVLFPELWSFLDVPPNLATQKPVPYLRAVLNPKPSSQVDSVQPRDAEPETIDVSSPSPVTQEEPFNLADLLGELWDEHDLEPLKEELARMLWGHLEAFDQRVEQTSDSAPSHAMLLGTLLLPFIRVFLAQAQPPPETAQLIAQLVDFTARRLLVSRRDKDCLKNSLIAQRTLTYRSRRNRPFSLIKRDFFPDALFFLELSHMATGQYQEALTRWNQLVLQGGKSKGRRSGRSRRKRR